MQTPDEMLATVILLWAVIDPIGTVPVFVSATRNRTAEEKKEIARYAATIAGMILLFFAAVGEVMLDGMGVPLPAFQIAGGLVLFLFAMTMIFGEGKPGSELKSMESTHETAVFPLATPSIASPGAMMAVVLLTENGRHSVTHQIVTAGLMLGVICITYLLMRASTLISNIIGLGGASVISRVMGLVLSSIAVANVLEGISEYFNLSTTKIP
ncbi:MarC family protein [Thalassoglobus sp. JC818]|uniref:MarC family protein n=1 Tax=Thalassoglobus sp. JC818 TaxID=3232136 RepID=UPI00345B2A4B